MNNYKALKAASKVSVRKQKVVDKAKVDAVAGVKYIDGDDIPEGKEVGDVKIEEVYAKEERSHEELQVTCKCYDANTGEAKDDYTKSYTLLDVKSEIERCKSDITEIEAKQSEWEELEKDLKAL